MRVVVVGAGAFGGWTALHLARAGHEVVLIDAWGPGHERSSSGGETRILRRGYGDDRLFTDLAEASRRQWLDANERWGATVFDPRGVVWMVGDDDAYERAAVATLQAAGVPHETWTREQLAERRPRVSLEGVRWALYEPDAGVLYARSACAQVAQELQAAGGALRSGRVAGPRLRGGRLDAVDDGTGTPLTADAFVFACGPWLGDLFPDVLGQRIVATRQEVFLFALPPGPVTDWPVWADHGGRFWYGIPEAGDPNGRGAMKVADDTRGAPFDPTAGDRTPSEAGAVAARRQLALRFPSLGQTDLLGGRVCQYEDTPDGDFIVDRHPGAENVWLVGGGSGHGFKHGPALGALVAAAVQGQAEVPSRFSLSRFD